MSSVRPITENSCVSLWQATNRGRDSLYGHNDGTIPTTAKQITNTGNNDQAAQEMPEEADIVIVGGGTMGASLAYFLTREGGIGKGQKVVVLEARDVASGASGKNGGHVGPSTSGAYSMHQKPIGQGGSGVSSEEAVKIVQSERENLELISKVIKDEELDVDFWRGYLCEVHESQKSSDAHVAAYRAWIAAREACAVAGDHDTRIITDAEEAKKLFTWAPVTSYIKMEDGRWDLQVSHGGVSKGIKAGKVVLCTNAYTKNFFKKDDQEEELLHSHIRPAYAQCSLITPTRTYSGQNALQYTYNMDGDFYLVQTPGGGMVLGGWDLPLLEGRETRIWHRVGNEDDSSVLSVWTKFLANYCRTRFAGWGKETVGEGATRTWSALMTDSKDALPLVGEAPGKEGMYISAGFHGHGQSRIFIIAKGLAEDFLRTGEWPESLPKSFMLTQERLEQSRHVGQVMDVYSAIGDDEVVVLGLNVQAKGMLRE
ncbi:hypothetical protein QFC21_006691 [Naganishia friedmannii]|uniref:Uncharacterized protein n=1 Tax=Naganishia friedmannii TaxID=89922 RepID=A0ACC2V0E5_9TREE|nr:hypothetical protein QFC21_006691 [Naganishia friedmannii]